ncbi:MAG TPA: YjbQ family protein [Anaerolineae bacterium]|nr:YjbQ family protein [Anaerolineae bacterium]
MITKVEIQTPAGENLVDITKEVQQVVHNSGIEEGLCILYVPHTTAGITINSAMDNETLKDIISEFHRLVPTRVDFNHTYDTPSDAAGHIKSVLTGSNISLLVVDGELLIGSSQSILFFEFDCPRSRKIFMRVLSDSE